MAARRDVAAPAHGRSAGRPRVTGQRQLPPRRRGARCRRRSIPARATCWSSSRSCRTRARRSAFQDEAAVRGPARRALLHLGAADGGDRDRRESGGDRDRPLRSPRARRGRHVGPRHGRPWPARRQRRGGAMRGLRSAGPVRPRGDAAADRVALPARKPAAPRRVGRPLAGLRPASALGRAAPPLPRRGTRSSRRPPSGGSPSICRSSPSSIGSRGGAHGARGFPVRLRRDG